MQVFVGARPTCDNLSRDAFGNHAAANPCFWASPQVQWLTESGRRGSRCPPAHTQYKSCFVECTVFIELPYMYAPAGPAPRRSGRCGCKCPSAPAPPAPPPAGLARLPAKRHMSQSTLAQPLCTRGGSSASASGPRVKQVLRWCLPAWSTSKALPPNLQLLATGVHGQQRCGRHATSRSPESAAACCGPFWPAAPPRTC